jgi:hypothetical protein
MGFTVRARDIVWHYFHIVQFIVLCGMTVGGPEDALGCRPSGKRELAPA